VAGLGKAGSGAVELLRRRAGAGAVRVWDGSRIPHVQRLARQLRATGIQCSLGGDGTDLLVDGWARCLVKSPGIPLEHPLVIAARESGLAVVDELELAWRASPLPMVAITGTKGKSTITTLVAALGRAATGDAHMAGNTDFAPALSAITATTGIVSCEVSSQQLEGCTDLLPEVAILTNVHGESNRHGSLEATAAIKQELFVRGERCVPVAILNVDDGYGAALVGEVERRGGRVVRYGLSPAADYRVLGAEWSLDEARVELTTPYGGVTVAPRLPGLQNAVNVAAALAAGVEMGLSPECAAAVIAETDPPPGRYQQIDCGQPFDVMVDMAHTPASIEEILRSLRAVVDRRSGAALRAVVGAPGSFTMPAPRVESGRIARELTDQLVVTGASLRGEPPLINLQSILRGARASSGGVVQPVLSRAEGIRFAIESAQPTDVVVMIGRGPLRPITLDGHGGELLGSDAELAMDALQRVVR
jgi:UDP-N-acetylmuramoylalanine-D-glutamate ligase